MNIAFAGFRHSHILALYDSVQRCEGVDLIGCFEENIAVKEQVEAEKGISFSYPSYEELLKDERVDVVAVGDYYGIRGKRIIEALKAGKHVIADKPLCTHLDELMDEVAINDYIRITYNGLKKTSNGYNMKIFNVERRINDEEE